GLRRQRRGRSFSYVDVGGQPVRDPEALARIRALGIPPAWRDVWICPIPTGHLQAVGTDAAGRRQYLYTRPGGPDATRPSSTTCWSSPTPCPGCGSGRPST
ncbi:MAG TPA: hypothetical protein VLR51_02150, partial [Actinomycetes bacterium]|nr:hypothetical protein [Actinomycetes bacterium]